MATQIVLITGGARSGKSIYAEQRAAALGSRRLYVATAEPKDEEMTRRIARTSKDGAARSGRPLKNLLNWPKRFWRSAVEPIAPWWIA